MRTITILKLLDRMEELLTKSLRIPLTGWRIIDEEKFFVMSSKIRTSLPDEIKQAIQIQAEARKIKEDAEKEGESIKEQAISYAEKLVSNSEVTRQANERAKKILEEAQEEAKKVQEGAEEKANEAQRSSDEYALGVLKELQDKLNQHLSTVGNYLKQMEKN